MDGVDSKSEGKTCHVTGTMRPVPEGRHQAGSKAGTLVDGRASLAGIGPKGDVWK
jgi:hypothetical protein